MGSVRRTVGFWTAVGRLRLSDLVTVEAGTSVVLGAGLSWLLWAYGDLAARTHIAESYLAVSAALVAIVFAGLALVASLLSDSYLRLLDSSDSGVLGFFRPFLIAVGVQVATLVGSLLYSALASLIPPRIEPWIFGALSVLFFASCLEIVVLTRSVLMHALLRNKFASTIENTRARNERRSGGQR